MNWHVNNDNFFYAVQTPPEIYTRRKVLSVIASVFDPMGLVSPFVLLGKQILQEACAAGLNWDDDLPDPIKQRYKEWCVQLQELSSLTIPRCIKPHDFNVSSIEFHHFADASTSGYGVCSYIRYIDQNGSGSVSLVYAKSRVSPNKPVTIPCVLSSPPLYLLYAVLLCLSVNLNLNVLSNTSFTLTALSFSDTYQIQHVVTNYLLQIALVSYNHSLQFQNGHMSQGNKIRPI